MRLLVYERHIEVVPQRRRHDGATSVARAQQHRGLTVEERVGGAFPLQHARVATHPPMVPEFEPVAKRGFTGSAKHVRMRLQPKVAVAAKPVVLAAANGYARAFRALDNRWRRRIRGRRERRRGWGSYHRGHRIDVDKRRDGYAYIILAIPAHPLAQGTATVEEQRLSRREMVDVLDGRVLSRRHQALDRLRRG